MKNTTKKKELKVKNSRSLEASIHSMLSKVLTHFVLINAVVQHPVIHWINDPRQISGIDRVCIDKTSSAELTEAINSMYQWYKNSKICYVYLSDVRVDGLHVSLSGAPQELGDRIVKSRWFTRGWTLQELIAPDVVDFYSSDWVYIISRDD